jgi:molecular chaperone GrpE
MNFKYEEFNNSEETQDQNDSQPESANDNQKSEVDMCLTELSLWKDQCKRISADFENFKKRTEKEQSRWTDVAKESILYDLLSFVDAFEIALTQPNIDKVALDMLHQSILKILAKNDVKSMPEVTEFNPEFHEAVMQVASQDRASGEIVQFLSKGFMLKDRVLRPAKVSVAL